MRYREYAPAPRLRGIVHRFWTLRAPALPRPADFQRAMPDGRPELIFNLADPFERWRPGGIERQCAAMLVGPTTRALEVRPTGRVDLFGVRLAPGLWPAVLGVAAGELLDHTVPLSALGGPWREDLREPLAELSGDEHRVALIKGRLELLLRRADPPADRLQRAIELTASGGVRRVPVLAERVGVSERHLTRLFRAGTGMSPKLLSGLARFQSVLAELERPVPVRWAAIAQRHGYYDQAHLARDFRRFGGISPGTYLRASRELTRHFVDRDAPRA